MQMCALLCAEPELMIWYALFSIASADPDSFGEGSFIFLQPGKNVTRPTQLHRRSSSYGRGLEIRGLLAWPTARPTSLVARRGTKVWAPG